MTEDKKIYFDLNLLEMALTKAIEILNLESEILSSKLNVNPQQLNIICDQKEDIMNFIDWHIPIIVRYIKVHKDAMDDIDDLKNLAVRAGMMNKELHDSLKNKLPFDNKNVIGNDKRSSITIIHTEEESKEVLEVIFTNDSEDTPKIISSLLKEMMTALEINFNKISARKKLNDQILDEVGKKIAVDKKQKESYNPTTRKKGPHSSNDTHVILNQDC
jgi:hypothetical protein